MAKGIEQLRQDRESVQSQVKYHRDSILTAAYPHAAPRIINGIEHRVLPALTPEFPNDFADQIRDKLDQNGAAIVDINHQGHGDGLAGLNVATQMIEMSKDTNGVPRIKGFIMPIALTILTGDQGDTLKDLVNRMTEFTQKHGVQLEDYIREKDRIKRNLTKEQMTANNMHVVRTLLKAVREGYGIMFFPEGTIEGGRTNGMGGVNGMQPYQEDIINPAVEIMKRLGKNPFHVPVGVDGTYKLQNIDHGNTPRTRFILGTIAHQVFLPDVSVRVGDSVWHSDLESGDISVAHQLGYLTSKLIPEERRGFYRDIAFAES